MRLKLKKRGFDVVSVGSAVVDAFVFTGLPEKNKSISYPAGSKILVKDLKFDTGGGGTNTAVAFSRLGLKTGYIGKLGEDENGKKILSELKTEKVSFLGKRQGITGYSVILDSREHERTILTYKGSNNDLKFSEIKVPRTNWLYLASMIGESFNTQVKIAATLKAEGVKIAFNPSEYLIKRENIAQLLRLTDVLILNKEEAELLLKSEKNDLLKSLSALGPEIVCITNKDKEILAYDGEKEYKLKPHKVKVVERTGAGDAFASGFVAGLIKGWGIEKSMSLGLRNSESVIRHFGAKNKLLRI